MGSSTLTYLGTTVTQAGQFRISEQNFKIFFAQAMLQGWKERFENLVILFDFLKEAFYPSFNSHDLYRSESIDINSYLGFTRDIYIDNTLSTVRLPGRLNT